MICCRFRLLRHCDKRSSGGRDRIQQWKRLRHSDNSVWLQSGHLVVPWNKFILGQLLQFRYFKICSASLGPHVQPYVRQQNLLKVVSHQTRAQVHYFVAIGPCCCFGCAPHVFADGRQIVGTLSLWVRKICHSRRNNFPASTQMMTPCFSHQDVICPHFETKR